MIIIVWVAGGDLEAVKPKGSFDQWCKRLRHAWGLNSIPWQGDGVPEWAPSLLAQQRSLFPWRILNYVLDQTGRGKTNKTHTHTHVHTPKNPLLFENYCFISYLVCLIKKNKSYLGEGNESSWRFKELWKKPTCALLFGWSISLLCF